MHVEGGFPRNLAEFERRFETEEACEAYLFEQRWPDGWTCACCGARTGWRNRRGVIECSGCGHQGSLTAGTVFAGTKKPLRMWFRAMFWMINQKNGFSAKSLQRLLGISYPTAWTWLHKLRAAMGNRTHLPLKGRVEVDETYWGAERRGKIGRPKAGEGQALILVATEEKETRIGRARLMAVPDHSQRSFVQAVETHVAPHTLVRSDGLNSFAPLAEKGYDHRPQVIGKDTSRAHQIFPKVHRVISLLKRWLLGTHQGAVQPKHLPAYLEEFEFRFNRRSSTHRTLLFVRLFDNAVRTAAKPYWRILGRTAPRQPLQVVPT
jgi:transposase-like protein